MDCNAAERAILECRGDLPEGVRKHVAECSSCQTFSRLQDTLLETLPGMEPPPALDRAVLAAAHRRLRRGWRVLPRWLPLSRVAAAALVLVATATMLLRRRPDALPQETAVTLVRQPVVPPAPKVGAARHWAGALVDLEVIEGGLDAAREELGSMDAPGRGQGVAHDGLEPWDALMELEFDVYFEAESLRQAGG